MAHARIVAGGDLVGAQLLGVLEEGLELDLGIAQHIGIGCASGLVFTQELGKHPLLVFGGEIHHFQIDADDIGHRGRIDEILA